MVIEGFQSSSSLRIERQTVPEGYTFGWKRTGANLHLGGLLGYSSENSIVRQYSPPSHKLPCRQTRATAHSASVEPLKPQGPHSWPVNTGRHSHSQPASVEPSRAEYKRCKSDEGLLCRPTFFPGTLQIHFMMSCPTEPSAIGAYLAENPAG